ncbi:MAG: cell division protein ZapA [Candidatus Eiseniibacteriota bacterium]
MSSEARTVSVQILGQEYKIRSTEDAAFVREVAVHVDEAMRAISARMTSATATQLAVLAALNFAEELLRERRNGGGGHDEADERLRAVLRRLDEIVAVVPADAPASSRR